MGNGDLAGVPIVVQASVKSASIFSVLKASRSAIRMGFRFRSQLQNTERVPIRTFSAPKALAVYLFE
jgi:hypothetical protein